MCETAKRRLGKRLNPIDVNDVYAAFKRSRYADALTFVRLDLLFGVELIRRGFGYFEHKIVSFFGDSSREARRSRRLVMRAHILTWRLGLAALS